MEKVRKAVIASNEKIYKNQDFTTTQLGVQLDFDPCRHLRMLCRRGYIAQTLGTVGRSAVYLRSGSWPPLADFLAAENFGFTGYLQTWFRYYLKQTDCGKCWKMPNIKLDGVASNALGVSGRDMIVALVRECVDAAELAELRARATAREVAGPGEGARKPGSHLHILAHQLRAHTA